MAEYSKHEVVQILGFTSRTVQFYTDEGLIIPDVANPKGHGARRKYSRKNLFEFVLVKELTLYGLRLEKIHEIMFHLSIEPEKLWNLKTDMPLKKRFQLVVYNPHAKGLSAGFREGSSNITIDMGHYSGALVIDLSNLIKQIERV